MRRKLLIGIGVVIVVLLLVALILPHFIGANQYKPMLESQMKETLGGRNVTIGNVSIALLPGATAQIDGLSIADDPSFSKSPFLTAKQLKVGVNPMPLIFSSLECGPSPSSNRKSLCCVIRPAFGKSLDQIRLGYYASIGIQRGKPFAPDDRMNKILTEAVAVGDATARALLFHQQQTEAFLLPKQQLAARFHRRV